MGYFKSCQPILIEFLEGVGCMTSGNWLDVVGEPDHGSDTIILKEIFAITIIISIFNVALITLAIARSTENVRK